MSTKTTISSQFILQANKLIDAKQSISLQAKRVIYCSAKMIDENSENPLNICFSWTEFEHFAQVKNYKTNAQRKNLILKVAKNLGANPIIFENDSLLGAVQWIQSIFYNKVDQTVEIQFTQEVYDFFLYINKQSFTKNIYEIGRFRSIYTIRIKEFIERESFKKRPYFDITFHKLRFALGIENKYKQLSDLKKSVLEVAKQELVYYDYPIQFDYVIIDDSGVVASRYSKKASAVRIYPKVRKKEVVKKKIEKKVVEKIPDSTEKEHQAIFEILLEWGISSALIKNLINNYGIAAIEKAIQFVETKNVSTSKSGYFLKAIKNEWKGEQEKKEDARIDIQNKIREQARYREALEDKRNELWKQYYIIHDDTCDYLLSSNDGLLETIYNMAVDEQRERGSRIYLNSLISKTPEEAYHSKLTRFHITNKLLELYQDDFPDTMSDIKKRIEKLELEISKI